LDRVEKPGVQAAVCVAGQIDHDRDGLVGAADLRGPPDVLVDAKSSYTAQASGFADAIPEHGP
jgi:hypothetical protein